MCQKIKLYTLNFFFLFTLAACGEKLSGNEEERFGTPAPAPAQPKTCTSKESCPSTGFCEVSPFEGDERIVNLDDYPIESSYFGKTYSKVAADALLQSSGLATWQSILSSGLPVRKVIVDSRATCRFFSPLKITTREIEKRWKGLNSGSGPRNFLLGLFSTQISRASRGGRGQLNQPTITVREDTERWTLLHEYHHYLFARERVKNANFLFNDEMMAQLEGMNRELRKKLRGFENNPRPKKAQTIADLYQGVHEISLEIDKRGPLEEFSIEGLLTREFGMGTLKYVNFKSDLPNAVRYMGSNKRRVDADIENLRSAIQGFAVKAEGAWEDAKREHKSQIQGCSGTAQSQDSNRAQRKKCREIRELWAQTKRKWKRSRETIANVQSLVEDHFNDIQFKFREAQRISRQAQSFGAFGRSGPQGRNLAPTPVPHYDVGFYNKKAQLLKRLNRVSNSN